MKYIFCCCLTACCCIAIPFVLLTSRCEAQDVTAMLKDIKPGLPYSYPSNLVNVKGTLYFWADDGTNGYELWKSDGTPAGTVMVKDIWPGANGAGPQILASANGILYFTASDGSSGYELWKSDGTPAGTVMVKDINPGVSSSNPAYIANVNGLVYFAANDGINGYELWKSDGTPAGTVMVKDIYPGATGSGPVNLTNINGTLFFVAYDGTNGSELWKSDGTPAGTFMVKDINPGGGSSGPGYITNINGTVFFSADNGTNGLELWKSDGSSLGTVMVKDIYLGSGGSSLGQFTNVSGTLFFEAYDGFNGIELWKSDGSSLGTVMVKDINPGSSGSGPGNLANINGTLYFQATDGINGYEPWKSDGTSLGTVMVSDINPGASSSSPAQFTDVNGTVYFQAYDGTHGSELWKSDGTSLGTVVVKDINPGGSSSWVTSLTNINGPLYFQAANGINGGELWKSYTKDNVGKILSVSDIPNDQGGNVRLTWRKSAWDTTDGSGHVTSYGIWRKIPPGLMAAGYSKSPVPRGMSLLDDSLSQYDYLETVPAVRASSYHVVVPTLEDSSSGAPHEATYLITAHTTDANYYYVSASDSGYSVDNLAPIQPSGLVAAAQSGTQVDLTWNSPTDPDVGHYDIYRSTTSGFNPAPGLKIGTANSTSYSDGSTVEGAAYYYRIIAVDVHGNQSQPSSEASAAFPVTQTYTVNANWNMVSVPLIPADYAKTVLYPTAVSEAFAYLGSYVTSPTLQNGVAYWLRFSGDQSIPMTGLVKPVDTIDITEGWNMIGSVSASVPVASIGSIPGGLVTSQFFGYNTAYVPATSIEPGRGYWVKVSGAGKLILSSMPSNSSKIVIRPISEQPPPPPDGTNGMLPGVFSLGQNYPNPFNPTTVIAYTLPASAHVRLSVYNMLGQEVRTLVNEEQDAGYRSAAFDGADLPSGVYTYRLTAGTFTDVKKMMLVK